MAGSMQARIRVGPDKTCFPTIRYNQYHLWQTLKHTYHSGCFEKSPPSPTCQAGNNYPPRPGPGLQPVQFAAAAQPMAVGPGPQPVPFSGATQPMPVGPGQLVNPYHVAQPMAVGPGQLVNPYMMPPVDFSTLDRSGPPVDFSLPPWQIAQPMAVGPGPQPVPCLGAALPVAVGPGSQAVQFGGNLGPLAQRDPHSLGRCICVELGLQSIL